jgi:hypothetical protein
MSLTVCVHNNSSNYYNLNSFLPVNVAPAPICLGLLYVQQCRTKLASHFSIYVLTVLCILSYYITAVYYAAL